MTHKHFGQTFANGRTTPPSTEPSRDTEIERIAPSERVSTQYRLGFEDAKSAILEILRSQPASEPTTWAGTSAASLDVERLAQALSCWSSPIRGEGDPEFTAWAEQMIRSYLRLSQPADTPESKA